MDDISQEPRVPPYELSQEELKIFFVSHLSRVYCAKSQLTDRLPEFVHHAHFLDLKQAIEETIEIVNNQMVRMRQMFIMLDSVYMHEGCTGLIGILDEAFQSISPRSGRPALRDLSILFYMENIESIEMASFKILKLVALKMNDKKVAALVQECYDEAKDDNTLFKQIAARYM